MKEVFVAGDFSFDPLPNRLASLFYECLPEDHFRIDLGLSHRVRSALSTQQVGYKNIVHNQLYLKQPQLIISTKEDEDPTFHSISQNLAKDQRDRSVDESDRTIFLPSTSLDLDNLWLYNDQVSPDLEDIPKDIDMLVFGTPPDQETDMIWVGHDSFKIKRPERVLSWAQRAEFVIATIDQLPLLLRADVPFGLVGESPLDELLLEDVDQVDQIKQNWADISNRICERRIRMRDAVLQALNSVNSP